MSTFEYYLEAAKKLQKKIFTNLEVSSEKMTWDEAMAEAGKGKRLLQRLEMVGGVIKHKADERETARNTSSEPMDKNFFKQYANEKFWSATQVGTQMAYAMEVPQKISKKSNKMVEHASHKADKYYAIFVKN